MKLVLDYGFNKLGLIRVQAGIKLRNKRAGKALKRAGFILEARLYSFYDTLHGRDDLLIYRKLGEK